MDMTFFRAQRLLGACVLLSGCDSATTPATPTATATVLDGKTMGTFWRVSVIGVDKAKAQALRAKLAGPAGRRRSPAVELEKRLRADALQSCRHYRTMAGERSDGGYRHPVAADWRQNARRDGYYRGAAGQPVGLWPG